MRLVAGPLYVALDLAAVRYLVRLVAGPLSLVALDLVAAVRAVVNLHHKKFCKTVDRVFPCRR